MAKIDKKLVLNLIKYLFLILVIYFVARFMIKSIGELGDLRISIDYRYIVAAYLAHFLYLVSRASLWHHITCLNKVSLPFGEAFSVWFISLLGKFIPGKVFYLGARVYHYKKKGRSGSLVTYSFFIEYLASMAASLLMFVLSFSLISRTSFDHYRGVGALIVLAILLFLHPRIMNSVIALANKILKRKLPLLNNIKYSSILLLTVMYLVSWSLLGLGFFLLVNSVFRLPIADFPYVAGSFALATIIGILSLFAPSGIGVREAVVIATMNQIMQAGLASIVSILARIWATSSELFWIMLVFLFSKMRLPGKKQLEMDISTNE